MVNGPHETVAGDAEPTAAARRYKPYLAYKNSGVEWFGEIPNHWEVLQIGRIGNLSKCNGGTKADEVSEGVPCIRYGDLYTYHTCFIQQSRSYVSTERASDYTSIEFGDILFAASGETIDEIGKSAVNLIDTHACCGGDIIRLRPTANVNSRFMGYATDSSVATIQKGRMGRGITVMHVYGDELKYLALAVPFPSEQHAIATYLERETTKIDALIAEKKRLIELLKEKRTALITRAVTKGLDPDATMKNSGVEWLGEIPKHWEMKRVAELALTLQTGPFGSQLHAADYITGEIPVINPANLISGILVPDSERTVDEQTANRLGIHKLLQGDILFARRGDVGRCGLVGKQQEGWLCGTGCLRMRPCSRSAESSYLLYLLSTQGVGDWLRNESVGSTMQNLNTSIIGRIPAAIPGLAEQRRISEFLDRETTKIDTLVAKVREAIDRLKELRIALISAAVTGKIDVRKAVP